MYLLTAGRAKTNTAKDAKGYPTLAPCPKYVTGFGVVQGSLCMRTGTVKRENSKQKEKSAPRTGRILTYKMLVDACACQSQRRKVKRLFGTQVHVTIKLCEQYALDFQWWWAALMFLSFKGRCA